MFVPLFGLQGMFRLKFLFGTVQILLDIAITYLPKLHFFYRFVPLPFLLDFIGQIAFVVCNSSEA